MFDADLSAQLDRTIAMEDYYRLKLLEWRTKRAELESLIDTETIHLINEMENIAAEAWDNGVNKSYNN